MSSYLGIFNKRMPKNVTVFVENLDFLFKPLFLQVCNDNAVHVSV